MASIQATPTEQASVGLSVSAFGTHGTVPMKKSKPGWMLPLPKEDRGKGFLRMKTRGPLRESDAERELDFEAARAEPFTERLADAASRGGRTELGNIVPSCGPCNRRKRTKTAQEWLRDGFLAFKRQFDAINETVRLLCEVQS